MQDVAIPVSPSELCTTHLTDGKRRAISDYLTLAPELRDRHGRKPAFSPREVREAIAHRGLSIDHITWAFLLYCGPTMFQQVHAAQGCEVNYTALRGAVAGTYFGGDIHFDATGFSQGAEMPTDSAMGAPVDVDLSGLMGW